MNFQYNIFSAKKNYPTDTNDEKKEDAFRIVGLQTKEIHIWLAVSCVGKI